MKYLGAVFLTLVTMLSALILAIVKEGAHLGRYEWAVPYLAGLLVLSLIAAVISFVKAGRQSENKITPPPRKDAPINIHLENIGNPIHDQSTRRTIAPMPSVPEVKRNPEIELFDCKPGFIHYEGSVWSEADPSELDPKEDQPNACLAIFRNKPAPAGQVGVPAYEVTAHLTYRNEKGERQIVNFGTWIGKYEHRIDFTRGESHALVLSSSTRAGKEKDGRVYVLDNPHAHNPFTPRFRSGMTIYAPDEKPMLVDCNEVEVSLICKNITVYSGKLTRAAESGDSTQFKRTT
jgi:hypothetical protein